MAKKPAKHAPAKTIAGPSVTGQVQLLSSALDGVNRRLTSFISGEVRQGAVSADSIQSAAVTTDALDAGAVTTAALAAGAVTADKIEAGTITATEIAAGSITGDRIAATTITATNIASATITATQISAGTITSTQIQAGSINSDRLYAGAVQAQRIQTDNLAAHVITANEIAANTITANELAANSVTTVVLAADSVTSAKIAANTITAGDIAAHTITAGEIAAGTITATEISAATITGSLIAASTITATNIASATITSGLLAANAVTSTAIASGAVTATKINVSTLSAITADMGTLTAGRIRIGTAGGARLEVGSSIVTTGGTYDGIVGADSSNNVTFLIDAATGNASFKGTLLSGSTGLGNIAGSIDGGTKIDAGSVTGNRLVAGTITATELATDSVTSIKILATTIVAGDIASGTITATQIQAGSITADRMNVTSLSAISANLGTITAGTVTGATLRTASGDRVELNSTKLLVNVGSTDVITLDPTNGLVLVPGTGAVNTITWKTAGGVTYGDIGARQITDYGGSDTANVTRVRALNTTGTKYGQLQLTYDSTLSYPAAHLEAVDGSDYARVVLAAQEVIVQRSSGSGYSELRVNSSVTASVGGGAYSITILGSNGDSTLAPIGGVQMWAGGSTPPTNWLMCNGQAVSRTTNATLFAKIGTTWGAGDGSTTFNVPNFNNFFPVGAGGSYAQNATGGAASVTLTGRESGIQDHIHQYPSGTTGFLATGASNAWSPGAGGGALSIQTATGAVGAYPALDAHENRPPYRGIYFIIRAQ